MMMWLGGGRRLLVCDIAHLLSVARVWEAMETKLGKEDGGREGALVRGQSDVGQNRGWLIEKKMEGEDGSRRAAKISEFLNS